MESLTYAPKAWRALNGIFCVYKPVGLINLLVRKTLCYNLCRDLNELDQRESSQLVCINGSVCSKKPFEVTLTPNLAEHELVSGPKYQPQDFRMRWVYLLGQNTSGVLLMAVNDGCKLLSEDKYKSFLRKYEVHAKFGMATDTLLIDGKVKERSTFSHVTQSALDRVLASIQTSHQRLVFDYAGVGIQSQAAYNLASSGLVRPVGHTKPIIYNIKCVKFTPPYFVLEVLCINENEEYLKELVHDIGINLKTNAVTKQLRCVQYGHFTVSHALLRKHWTLENILNNIALCNEVLRTEVANSDFRHIKEFKEKGLIGEMQDQVREESL